LKAVALCYVAYGVLVSNTQEHKRTSQNRLHFYWNLKKKRKEDNDWVKKCMEYEVEGPRPRGRPKRTWREDFQARKLNTEDAMDRSKWRKLIKDVWWSGRVWVFECLFWYRPTRVVPDQWRVCVCVLFKLNHFVIIYTTTTTATTLHLV